VRYDIYIYIYIYMSLGVKGIHTLHSAHNAFAAHGSYGRQGLFLYSIHLVIFLIEADCFLSGTN
jgi:hypothetical protein